jgi:hypothetical protein
MLLETFDVASGLIVARHQLRSFLGAASLIGIGRLCRYDDMLPTDSSSRMPCGMRIGKNRIRLDQSLVVVSYVLLSTAHCAVHD